MDYDLIRAALFILGGVLFYALLSRGLFRATEPSRQKALDIAERLFHSSQVSEARKAQLDRRLDEVYSNWQAWKLTFWMFEVALTLPFRRPRMPVVRDGIPHQFQKDFARFIINWMIATVGNSPAAALLFATLVLIALAFSASIAAISSCLAGDQNGGGAHGAKAT
ncbi:MULTISPECIES: hypothetical protein [Bradyrhizobium]|uniref:Uncharacterized protein n=1 Tax=Bradyrhizobium brasilense TaxID=1419277 RepID=A0ABY8JQI2_9BRAD|nr:hypothetical protein [Bradyrhizobium brasilense]WFU67716.1 hypothetical protein QA636_20380 [Bradyrhizobium brasilense]